MAINPRALSALFTLLTDFDKTTHEFPYEYMRDVNVPPALDMLYDGEDPWGGSGVLLGMDNKTKGNVVGIANSLVQKTRPTYPYTAPSNMQELTELLTKSAKKKLRL